MFFFLSNISNEKARDQIKKHLSGMRANKWLIIVIFFKKQIGHAYNIRFNAATDKIEFVDGFGDIVNFILNGSKQFIWEDINFQEMDQFFLYTYKDGFKEWGVNKNN